MSDASNHDSGVRLTVIDNFPKDDGFLPRCRALHPRHFNCHDVQSMVTVVLNAAGHRKIARLRIFGHGHEGSQRVGGGQGGNDHQRFWVDPRGRLHNQGPLKLLCHHFTPHALVQLHGCEVAHGRRGLQLLRRLADLWGVRVQAAVKIQHANRGSHFNGRYIEWDGSTVFVPMTVHDDL